MAWVCRLELLIELAVFLSAGDPRQPNIPLVRLRVEHGEEHETFGGHLLGRKFQDRVANPRDLVIFHKRRTVNHTSAGVDLNHLREVTSSEALETSRMEDLVREYFETADETRHMMVLTDCGMQEAVKQFVEKDVTDAIADIVRMQEARAMNKLLALGDSLTEDRLEEEVCKMKAHYETQPQDEVQEIRRRIQSSQRQQPRRQLDDEDDDEQDIDEFEEQPAPSRGRGGRRGRSTAASSVTTRRPRGRQKRGLNL